MRGSTRTIGLVAGIAVLALWGGEAGAYDVDSSGGSRFSRRRPVLDFTRSRPAPPQPGPAPARRPAPRRTGKGGLHGWQRAGSLHGAIPCSPTPARRSAGTAPGARRRSRRRPIRVRPSFRSDSQARRRERRGVVAQEPRWGLVLVDDATKVRLFAWHREHQQRRTPRLRCNPSDRRACRCADQWSRVSPRAALVDHHGHRPRGDPRGREPVRLRTTSRFSSVNDAPGAGGSPGVTFPASPISSATFERLSSSLCRRITGSWPRAGRLAGPAVQVHDPRDPGQRPHHRVAPQ